MKSFEFLLEREPKEPILLKFNLKIINRYSPEYEETAGMTGLSRRNKIAQKQLDRVTITSIPAVLAP